MFLEDVTNTFNYACKNGLDDVLWCGWQAEQWNHKTRGRKKDHIPSAGTHMIIFSAKGCRKLLPLAQNVPDSHMGSFMKMHVLQKWHNAKLLNGGFVSPPLAGYYTHSSTTCGMKTLEDHWSDSWSQEGTRERPGHPEDKPRQLYIFRKKQTVEPVGEPLHLPAMADQCLWITECPPDTPAASCGVRPRHRGEVIVGHFHAPTYSRSAGSAVVGNSPLLPS